jgi:uncharacterized protein (TIGR02001 family)
MNISRIAVAGVLLAAAGAANAGLTVTPTLASDYDFRGVSQTDPGQDGDVAFQLGATFAAENGFYVGAWGSNVDFGSPKPDLEFDYFAGFAGTAPAGFGYDVGVVYYTYPGASSSNTFEVYGGITKDWFNAKLWFSPEVANTDDSAFYLETNLTFPLPQGFAVTGHLGYGIGDTTVSFVPDETLDYSVGVTKSLGNFALAVKYVDVDLNGWPGNRVVATISTTLPWASE